MNDELPAVAQILADWIGPHAGIKRMYLFGSRVRGDHRADSDVDVRLFPQDWDYSDNATIVWWNGENDDLFRTINSRLPGRLEIHHTDDDASDAAIRAASNSPVLIVGRVVCVWTPPKR